MRLMYVFFSFIVISLLIAIQDKLYRVPAFDSIVTVVEPPFSFFDYQVYVSYIHASAGNTESLPGQHLHVFTDSGIPRWSWISGIHHICPETEKVTKVCGCNVWKGRY